MIEANGNLVKCSKKSTSSAGKNEADMVSRYCAGGILKFNLHIVEHCNYSCRHCFAKFNCRRSLRLEQWKKIVDNCHNAFPDCYFNIAGGEPLLTAYFTDLVRYCRELGHRVSVITNGSLITDRWIRENVPLLDTVGISLDSLEPDTMLRLGRCSRTGKYLDRFSVREIMEKISAVNPDCKIKVNTVVSSFNKDENIGEEIRCLPVSRWKILKMLPFDNGCFNNYELKISNDEYEKYICRNVGQRINLLSDGSHVLPLGDHCSVVVENNLQGGYLMIDANGELVDDTLNTNYVPVVNCIEHDVRDGMARLNFNRKLYMSRYGG